MIRRFCNSLTLFGLLVMTPSSNAAAEPTRCESRATVKVKVTASGIYKLPIADLRQAFGCEHLAANQLELSNQGQTVPYATLTGAPGDLIFVARHLAGEQSYYNEFSRLNTYWLTLSDSPERPQPITTQVTGIKKATPLRSWTRLESDEIRVRFPGRPDAPQPEVWYWKRLNSIDPKAFDIALNLEQRQEDSVPLIKVGLRGWSTLPAGKHNNLADHRLDILLNGHPIGFGEWLKQDEHVIEISNIPAGVLRAGEENLLSFKVPERKAKAEEPPLADAVLLNWVEIEYRHQGELARDQHYFRVPHQDGGWFELAVVGDSPPVVMSEQGRLLAPFEVRQEGQKRWYRFYSSGEASAYGVVVDDAFHQAESILADTASDLRNEEQQTDYLMITHHRLLKAMEPLAEFHRQNGLNVRLVDVEDIYDEFNHGVLAPAAIRDFISHAYHHWQQPAPRFVLLAGDASWDVRNEVGIDRNYADWTFNPRETKKFIKNSSYDYQDGSNAAHRNLIPTWPVETYQGYAASDNVFVAIDGDDFLPDLAIGRFPVSDPADATAIVNKTIAYHRQSEVGPWRRKVLWITNEQTGFQRTSDRLDDTLGQNGFSGTKVYPAASEKDNTEHQATLQSAFDDGQLLVHFLGHGGRYIWRTGPPDFRKNHDLFTLDHLDQLTPTTRLPFVLSMTCYSAPFDHPTADSIGEKFLRLPDRGAIGILAASWRNSPSRNFSQAMLDELTRPGTMGEAVMRAKQSQKNSRLMIETYNLLGDPATRLALPGHSISLKPKQRRDYLQIKGQVVDASFDGQAIIDWLDPRGGPIHSEKIDLRRGKFKYRIKLDADQEIGEIRAYAWSQESAIDALGGISLVAEEAIQKSPARQRRADRLNAKTGSKPSL